LYRYASLLWKSYIDFEIMEGERELTRKLYERLLDRTQHVKVGLYILNSVDLP
jgi:hypothetical protein